jgi:hypothetical protein
LAALPARILGATIRLLANRVSACGIIFRDALFQEIGGLFSDLGGWADSILWPFEGSVGPGGTEAVVTGTFPRQRALTTVTLLWVGNRIARFR